MTFLASANLLRRRGPEARVTFVELFFDLVYVFAVTQISHSLLHDPDPDGRAARAGLVVRRLAGLAVHLLGHELVRSRRRAHARDAVRRDAGRPGLGRRPARAAFGATGLVFAISYVVIQVGRTLFIVLHLGPSHPLSPNFRRMLARLCVSAVLWIAGGLSQDDTRLALWALAVACEYLSPMIGFRFPGLGRSATREWTIEGGHPPSAVSSSSSWRWARPC